jgi:hypothetical protein
MTEQPEAIGSKWLQDYHQARLVAGLVSLAVLLIGVIAVSIDLWMDPL